ncbi:esterase [Mycobacterium sp.]|uniref:LGFP repeat-containing protein n=1 Tax=Mycobacterium sp. TaxID=1785 RepID=UPI0025EC7274|nr:esterase [Mycobacterium sp.]
MAIATGLTAACSHAQDWARNPTGIPTTARIATAAGMVLVQGEILKKYQSLGGPDGPLGLPIGDAEPAPHGGWRQIFAGGAVYWSPQTGAHIVRGAIRTSWEYEYGGAAGPLGYPVDDEHPLAGGWQSRFQHGTITYTGGHLHVDTAAAP